MKLIKSLRSWGLILAVVCLMVGFVFTTSCAPAATPEEVASLEREVTSLQGEVASLKGEIASLREAAPVIRQPSAVMAIPNVGTSGATTYVYGADFEPGELVLPVYRVTLGGEVIEIVVTENTYGVEADELGCFKAKTKLPGVPGVYPLRVYDEQRNILAVTVVEVVE
jgi:hypothetical protein